MRRDGTRGTPVATPAPIGMLRLSFKVKEKELFSHSQNKQVKESRSFFSGTRKPNGRRQRPLYDDRYIALFFSLLE